MDGKSRACVSLLSSSFLLSLYWVIETMLLGCVEQPRRRLDHESTGAIRESCVAVEGKWVVPVSFHSIACFQNRAPS